MTLNKWLIATGSLALIVVGFILAFPGGDGIKMAGTVLIIAGVACLNYLRKDEDDHDQG